MSVSKWLDSPDVSVRSLPVKAAGQTTYLSLLTLSILLLVIVEVVILESGYSTSSHTDFKMYCKNKVAIEEIKHFLSVYL